MSKEVAEKEIEKFNTFLHNEKIKKYFIQDYGLEYYFIFCIKNVDEEDTVQIGFQICYYEDYTNASVSIYYQFNDNHIEMLLDDIKIENDCFIKYFPNLEDYLSTHKEVNSKMQSVIKMIDKMNDISANYEIGEFIEDYVKVNIVDN